jgi:hypothetical protein
VVGAEAGRLEANLLFVRRDGRLVPQGILPSFLDRIDAVGGTVPRDLFRPTNG